VHNSGYA